MFEEEGGSKGYVSGQGQSLKKPKQQNTTPFDLIPSDSADIVDSDGPSQKIEFKHDTPGILDQGSFFQNP